MSNEIKEQLKKIDKSLEILNTIKKKYGTMKEEQLKICLNDLIGGYTATLKGLQTQYRKQLKLRR